jgi:hypothetical protein
VSAQDKENKGMALSLAELECESGAVLPSRDTMFVFNFVGSSINANITQLVVSNHAGGNIVWQGASSEIEVNQIVFQGV